MDQNGLQTAVPVSKGNSYSMGCPYVMGVAHLGSRRTPRPGHAMVHLGLFLNRILILQARSIRIPAVYQYSLGKLPTLKIPTQF